MPYFEDLLTDYVELAVNLHVNTC